MEDVRRVDETRGKDRTTDGVSNRRASRAANVRSVTEWSGSPVTPVSVASCLVPTVRLTLTSHPLLILLPSPRRAKPGPYGANRGRWEVGEDGGRGEMETDEVDRGTRKAEDVDNEPRQMKGGHH